MASPLITLYGNIAIHSYGVALCLGVLLATWRASIHPWAERLSLDRLMHFVNTSVIVGIVGARILHIITEPHYYHSFTDMVLIWEGGLSSWGTVIALLCFMPLYTFFYRMPLLLMLDLFALHAPLVHVLSRFGCFFAGCCAGLHTTLPWAVMNECGEMVHPTQLYSAAFFALAFCFMRWMIAPRSYQPGQALTLYLCFVGIERFLLDWLRDDRVFPSPIPYLSVHQSIALCIIGVAGISWALMYRRPQSYEHF